MARTPITQMYVKRPYRQRYHKENRDRQLALMRVWNLATKYGITLEERWEVYAAQGFCCAGCGEPFPFLELEMDHDHRCCPPHKKGNRSAYCGKCNMGLVCHRCNGGNVLLKKRLLEEEGLAA